MNSKLLLGNYHITSPDPEYASCDNTYVKLLIYPGEASVDEVSKVLQLKPSSTQYEGQEIINSKGRVRFAKNSLWILSSEGRVASKDLRDHLDWLSNKLLKIKSNLKLLQNNNGLKMTVTCVWWSVLGHGGPVLWPEQMKALAELGLECSFDIYFLDNELINA